jgi:hypothetical protein
MQPGLSHLDTLFMEACALTQEYRACEDFARAMELARQHAELVEHTDALVTAHARRAEVIVHARTAHARRR